MVPYLITLYHMYGTVDPTAATYVKTLDVNKAALLPKNKLTANFLQAPEPGIKPVTSGLMNRL